VQDARRWTVFEEDNDRCFSLRGRDPATGRLRAADFRRCEDRFLQGANRRSQYATRARDYVLDASFLDAADLRFPFHRHYPLLLTLGGMDSRAAMALVDPFEWQQHAAALLRLYQDHPAEASDHNRRREALRELRASGQRTHNALAGLVLGPQPQRQPAFQAQLHAQVLDSYLSTLRNLAARVVALDDPETDRYGKRLTMGLDQPLPGGRRRAAIETLLAGGARGNIGLQPCSDAPESAFLAGESALLAESRRFFASPITAEEIAAGWNRAAIEGFRLAPASHAALVPAPFLWAALDGLGEIEICLATFRPGLAVFTREDTALRNHQHAQAEIDVRLEVRIKPGEALAGQVPGMRPDAPVLLASYSATRACSFGYRNDASGCSRGLCLGQLAGEFWGAEQGASLNGGSCGDAPVPAQFLQPGAKQAAELPPGLLDAVERLYWQGRAERRTQLLADARRSSEHAAASASYLQYFALATVTLGIWPDPSEPLSPMFSDADMLAPRAVLEALVEQHQSPATVEAQLAAERDRVLALVQARGREIERGDALYRLPQHRGLREVLTRIDLMLTAYGG